jgi:hypothetical protein
MPVGDYGRATGDCLVRFLWKVICRRKKGANYLALVIAHSDDLDVDLVLKRRLCEGTRRNPQEGYGEGQYFAPRFFESQRTSPFSLRRKPQLKTAPCEFHPLLQQNVIR